MLEGSFISNVSHLVEMGLFIVAFLAYRSDRVRDKTDVSVARDKLVEEQTRMHAENRSRLDTLTQFHAAQQIVNLKRDEQIAQLSQQSATLIEISRGVDRRLEMLEDRH